MEKEKKNFSAKQFVGEIKDRLKGRYAQTLGALLGISVISIAVLAGAAYLCFWVFRMLVYSVMMMMYGMTTSSSLMMEGLFLVATIILYIVVAFCVRYIFTAVTFKFQDVVRDDDAHVGFGTIYQNFKQIRKLQLIRLWLWTGLFMFLWQIVPDIIASFFSGSLAFIAVLVRLIAVGIMIWKGVEYSQSLFLYREEQPKFLGQSLRHALTASRRFMGGRKWNYIWMMIVVIVPLILWSAIWGGITYFGVYTWIPAIIYIAPIILILGIWAYLPVMFIAGPVYYEMNKENVDLDKAFTKTFLPEEKLIQQNLPAINRKKVSVNNVAEEKVADEKQSTDEAPDKK
ncbi:hypothetical protein LOOC260_103310 [Paucilactobacillus hokkaidonensis JCM 18461]|uniref:Uncharacterized protein n=2 Tax=Paucilactobacillus hokkaidonensis TaxID=1193095 RepID=A0A0A1GV36_9LACO|nr:hypothetical protein [Paucilactobacillus hokkaidonensis]BAP84909.1 hypothetical protein LOOC260_103310 [Paucilactobacillus hokkaidonensis JCM 18461]